MKTKLEVGKEYWLGEAKKYKGIYRGNFGKAHYFEVYGACEFTRDANGFIEFPLRGVFEIDNWHFITPIAMKFTEEQFNVIKDRLVEMGYRLYSPSFDFGNRYLCTGFNNDSKCATDVPRCSMYFYECKPVIIESFNPDLFLALAAMTDKEDGIKGEWWKAKAGVGFHVQQGGEVCGFTRAFFRKATAQEIIENFEKKEFVLPRFWHVVVTEENVDVLSKWRFGDEYPKYKLNIGYIVGFSSWQNSKQHNPSYSRGSFGSEITFEQFKKYVLKETTQSCQKTPVVGSIEYTVNVEFDAEKAAEELFAKIVEFGKSSQPEYKFTTESWHINDKKEIVLEDKTIISIPPTKQATLFDDRVEITDWKPKDNDDVLVVSINVDGWGITKTKYKFIAEPYKAHGFIKRTESEAKQLVEKLKQAML